MTATEQRLDDTVNRHPSVAYLASQYPAVSHTFIEREVQSVRKHGIHVHTFAIRPPLPVDLIEEANAAAAQTTTYLLGSTPNLLWSNLSSVFAHPLRYLRTFWASQALSFSGLRQRLLHTAYFLEAVHLAIELRRRRVRHVHVHFANNAASVALLATRFDQDLSYSLTVHGSLEFLDVQINRLEEKIAFASFVRCISNFCLGQVMLWSNPSQWDRFFVAHCGIDTENFLPRARQNKSANSVDLVAIGRLDPIKGFHVLLEACKRLEKEGVSWSLNLVGDGPLMPELVEHARNLKIDHKVIFVGAADQRRIREYLDAADTLVLSSFLEGLPVVLMEAMAMALPVIATRVGGVTELVEHEQSGLLVDAGSVDGLAAALLRLAREPALRIQLGEAGRKKVLAEFSVQQSGKELAAKFSQICAETPA